MTTTTARPTHTLTTWLTAEALEARDTSEKPLRFRMDPIEAEAGKYWADDPVVLTSSDGAVFIGHVEDVEDNDLRIYIVLD